MGTPPDVRTALRQTAARLKVHENLRERAGQDAQQLLEIATGLTRVQQLACPERVLAPEEFAGLEILTTRRLQAEPIQYLRGSQEFYGRQFLVTPDVLIPRPETEDIVTVVLEAVPDRGAPIRIADVGTGSGALAVTLALELPRTEILAIDISLAALAMAKRNAERLGAADRVRFLQSDLFNALEPDERFDIVVSNPPYISLGEAPTLHPEVSAYEPYLALFAGEDGYDVYRRLIPQAKERLPAGGLLVMETAGQVDLILEWLRDWDDVHVRRDLQGIARIVTARRH